MSRLSARWLYIALLTTATFCLVLSLFYQHEEVADFIAFWSASRLTLSGGNPYDSQTLHEVQLATGLGNEEPMLYFNPPWTTIIMMPLALFPLRLARAIWATTSLLMLIVAGVWLRNIFWPNTSRMAHRVAILIPILFVQGWEAVAIGQLSPLVLLGLVGAMRFYPQRPALGGVLLVLALVKPQLVMGALVLLGLRALIDRSWRFFAGIAGVLGTLLLILTVTRPNWPADYLSVFSELPLFWATPTIATLMRALFPTSPVVELFAAIAALLMVPLALWTIRSRSWNEGVGMAVLLTMLLTIYSWDFDHIMLLIPLYHLIARVRTDRRVLLVVGVSLGLVNFLIFVGRVGGISDRFFYFWVVPLFTLIYAGSLLWTRRREHSGSFQSNAGAIR